MERPWEQAETADRAVARAQRRGRNAQGSAHRAGAAWRKATATSRRSEVAEAAWRRAEPPLSLFRRDGQRNDRSWADAPVAAGLPGSFGLTAELRDALVPFWWLRRRRPRVSDPTTRGGHRGVAPLVQQILCQRLDSTWRESHRQVAAVSGRVVRARGAVDGSGGEDRRARRPVVKTGDALNDSQDGVSSSESAVWDDPGFSREESPQPLVFHADTRIGFPRLDATARGPSDRLGEKRRCPRA